MRQASDLTFLYILSKFDSHARTDSYEPTAEQHKLLEEDTLIMLLFKYTMLLVIEHGHPTVQPNEAAASPLLMSEEA